MSRQTWTLALSALFIALLGWYLVYTQRIVTALHEDGRVLTRIYAEVQNGITSTTPGAATGSLMELQSIIIEAGVPLILSGPGDTVLDQRNLPFEVDLGTPDGQAAVRFYMRALDAEHAPIGHLGDNQLHFGDPPIVRQLRWIPYLQVGGILLTVILGAIVIRSQRRAEAERAWTSMARELAHQLGTPLSSLQGWLEVLRLPAEERPGDLGSGEIVEAIEDDLDRLERVSHRFELIGRTPRLESMDLRGLLGELERYLGARLPRLGPGVQLEIDFPDVLPPINGNRVLLIWALENVLKNSLDALAGSGGTIGISAREDGGGIELRLEDNGPGVPIDIRDRLFEPGVTTKPGGWGVGLALTRRIIESVHHGKISLVETAGRGALFVVKLPRSRG